MEAFDEASVVGQSGYEATTNDRYLEQPGYEATTNDGGLKQDPKMDTGKKHHKCDVCGKDFTYISHLKRHLMAHTGEKNYVCTTCGKACACIGDLNQHLKIHSAEKPYECSYCGKAFKRSSSLNQHLNISNPSCARYRIKNGGKIPYHCNLYPFCIKTVLIFQILFTYFN